MLINAVGGGIAEVIISPIVEALPGEQKAASMALLHSFYCWGYLAVALLSTLFFAVIGIANWRVLPMLWALVPAVNAVLFSKVPIKMLNEDNSSAIPLKTLFSRKLFFLLLLMMLCAGAAEQAMAQWASFFAETGLGVSKTVGDLLGPSAFALFMGLSRIFYGSQSAKGKIGIETMLLISGVICLAGYITAVFAPYPLISLAGCALCGLAVGAMWPGTFSLCSRIFPRGGTPMFALLALAGDLGCGGGPFVVAHIAGRTQLSTGIFAAIIFPLLLGAGAFALLKRKA
jgi:Na+/melibiose symporter-like transporter